MISVAQALAHLFELATPLPAETLPLAQATGRVLLAPVVARRDQPPFAASAMDGYAVGPTAATGDTLTVIGDSAAGHGFDGVVGPGQAVRIFTGAPVPEGTQRIVIQEDVRREGAMVTLVAPPESGSNIRPKGGDFAVGNQIAAPRRLRMGDVGLIAAMNVPQVQVARCPIVALLATGDELVMPGDQPGPDQIIASNSFALKAMLEAEGAQVRILPIARDTPESLRFCLGLAADADLIVTTGGASVGDHDIVAQVAESLGMQRAFYKIAMRPGKPLMAGRLGRAAMVGLPGNPVSSLVCAHIFLRPMLRAMQGLPAAPMPQSTAVLAQDIDRNGPREHYMRAILANGIVTPFDRQDSSLMSILSQANALLIRPIKGPALNAGETVPVLEL